jgi:hypothetical protein
MVLVALSVIVLVLFVVVRASLAEVKLKRTSKKQNHTDFGARAYCWLPDNDPWQGRNTRLIIDSIHYFLLLPVPVCNSYGASRLFFNSS